MRVKRDPKTILIGVILLCISIVSFLNLYDNNATLNSILSIGDSDTVEITNITNGKSTSVATNLLLTNGFYDVSYSEMNEREINLKDWKKEFKMVFFKGHKEVAFVYLYTKEIAWNSNNETNETSKSYFNGKKPIGFLKDHFPLINHSKYIIFDAQVYRNLSDLEELF